MIQNTYKFWAMKSGQHSVATYYNPVDDGSAVGQLGWARQPHQSQRVCQPFPRRTQLGFASQRLSHLVRSKGSRRG